MLFKILAYSCEIQCCHKNIDKFRSNLFAKKQVSKNNFIKWKSFILCASVLICSGLHNDKTQQVFDRDQDEIKSMMLQVSINTQAAQQGYQP